MSLLVLLEFGCTKASDKNSKLSLNLTSNFDQRVTGWLTNGLPLQVSITGLSLSDISAYKFKCRIGPEKTADNLQYSDCNPTQAKLSLSSPVSGQKDGSFRFEVVAYKDSVLVGTEKLNFYVHSTLDTALKCPDLGKSDEEIMSDAGNYLDQSLVFDQTSFKNPIISISFPAYSMGTYRSPDGSLTDSFSDSHSPFGAFTAEILSLRKIFSMNASKTMILMKRIYGIGTSNDDSACSISVRQHSPLNPGIGLIPLSPKLDTSYYGNARCRAVVFNPLGRVICFDASGTPTSVCRAGRHTFKTQTIIRSGVVNWKSNNYASPKFKATEKDLYNNLLVTLGLPHLTSILLEE